MIYPESFEELVGFDFIRNKLIAKCKSDLGRNRVNGLKFLSTPKDLRFIFNCVREITQLKIDGIIFPESGFMSPESLLEIAAIDGNFIEAEDLLDFVVGLKTTLRCQEIFLHHASNCPTMHQIAKEINVPKAVISSIDQTIDDTGVVKDHASTDLSQIRQKLKKAERHIIQVTNKLHRQAVSESWISDTGTPTIRDGRPVIPVRSEHKRKIPGIVHGESSSGQTVYIEPVELVEAGNEFRELQFAERREVIRILKTITVSIRHETTNLIQAFEFLGIVEFNLAKISLSQEWNASIPQISDHPTIDWHHARHPHLLSKSKEKTIPLDIQLNKNTSMLIISGPNAGGKSVCIKTVALLQYMFQSGIPVPMDSHSTMGIFKSMLVDIGDQQSIESDLSTYSSHLKNMNYFINNATENSLIILDELGSGTDPNFGGGIAEAILENLLEKKTWVIATTHYYNLKLFGEKMSGVLNGAMKFDMEKMQPLYALEIGKPGSSFALEIAKRTGFSETLIQRAKEIVGKELAGIEQLIHKVERERQRQNVQQIELKQEKKKAQELRENYERLAKELTEKKRDILDNAKRQASALIQQTNKEIEKTIRHIKENKAEKKETKRIRQRLSNLKEQVSNSPEKTPTQKPKSTFEVNDVVEIIGQSLAGTIKEMKGNTALVEFGNIKTRINTSSLQHSSKQLISPSSQRITKLDVREQRLLFKPEVDIRGKRIAECAPILDKFIDDALLTGHHQLRILHGKGEGVLRKLVRDHFKNNPYVVSLHDEHVERGGDGITLITLK